MISSVPLIAEVGGISGSNDLSVTGDSNSSNSVWKIVSFSVSQDVVFSGTVASVSGNNITFDTEISDDNETIYPFFSSGCFDSTAAIPDLDVTMSGSTVSSITADYGTGGFQSNTGFSNPPEVYIDFPDGSSSPSQATATCSLDGSGKINSITVTSAGSAYSSAPKAKIIGGPHLVRITDSSSANNGVVFPITTNTQTTLTLSFAREASGSDATDFFSAGTIIEVIPATTLGSFMGIDEAELPANWNEVDSTTTFHQADLVWLYRPAYNGYVAMYFYNGGFTNGWYSSERRDGGALQNNAIIYPDEGVILQKRSGGTVTFTNAGGLSSSDKKLYLPEAGKQVVANNPLGMDIILAELIPSTSIKPNNHANDATSFKAGTSDSDTNADFITILDSSSAWKTYYYKAGINDSVTEMMEAGAKAGTGGGNAITANDLFIGSGGVTNVQSCSDTAGSSVVTNYNDGNYTKLTISGTRPGTGFSITFSDVQGYKLSDDGANEIDVSTGESVDTNGSGSVVYSALNGTHDVVGAGAGFVVIEKQRDVNFKSNEGSPSWNVGTTGAGYSASAKWWALGGGSDSNNTAYGTVTTGGSFTVTAGGSGYSSAPQIVISGGGWREANDATNPQGGLAIGRNDGLIIMRDSDDGVKTYIEPINPLK